jgi:hypothetical protein
MNDRGQEENARFVEKFQNTFCCSALYHPCMNIWGLRLAQPPSKLRHNAQACGKPLDINKTRAFRARKAIRVIIQR